MDLFSAHVDLVAKIVNKLNYHFVSKDDLLQVGLMGLFAASKNYNPDLKVKFNTYATYYILGEIKKELRKQSLIRLNKEIYRIIRYLKQHQEQNLEEIARALNTSRENVLIAYSFQEQILSLDREIPQHQEGEFMDLVSSGDDRKSQVLDAVEDLEPEQREIIKLRYFQNYTQAEVAEILKKNQSKISRMESRALMKMRKILLNK
jgi:RNA polymerase sporulation-specific sigma factor